MKTEYELTYELLKTGLIIMDNENITVSMNPDKLCFAVSCFGVEKSWYSATKAIRHAMFLNKITSVCHTKK